MEGVVLLKFVCEDCGYRWADWSLIEAYINPDTKEPIKCPKCGSDNIYEYDWLEVG